MNYLVSHHGFFDFFLNQVPEVIFVFQELRITFYGEFPGARNIDLDGLFYPTRPRSKNNHSIRQIDSFVDLVGNEENGFFGLVQYAQ